MLQHVHRYRYLASPNIVYASTFARYHVIRFPSSHCFPLLSCSARFSLLSPWIHLTHTIPHTSSSRNTHSRVETQNASCVQGNGRHVRIKTSHSTYWPQNGVSKSLKIHISEGPFFTTLLTSVHFNGSCFMVYSSKLNKWISSKWHEQTKKETPIESSDDKMQFFGFIA